MSRQGTLRLQKQIKDKARIIPQGQESTMIDIFKNCWKNKKGPWEMRDVNKMAEFETYIQPRLG